MFDVFCIRPPFFFRPLGPQRSAGMSGEAPATAREGARAPLASFCLLHSSFILRESWMLGVEC
jgi:hypothetical protein